MRRPGRSFPLLRRAHRRHGRDHRRQRRVLGAGIHGDADAINATWIAVAADDPDATFTTSASTLVVKVRWAATYLASTGLRTATATASATYAGGRTWRARVSSGAWLAAAGEGTFTLTPVATDPFGRITTDATEQIVVRAWGR